MFRPITVPAPEFRLLFIQVIFDGARQRLVHYQYRHPNHKRNGQIKAAPDADLEVMMAALEPVSGNAQSADDKKTGGDDEYQTPRAAAFGIPFVVPAD